jgi:hypothetical protein
MSCLSQNSFYLLYRRKLIFKIINKTIPHYLQNIQYNIKLFI